MRFNSVGDAATGFTQLGVNGAAVPGMAATTAGFPSGPSWFDDDTLFFQYADGVGSRLGTYHLPTTTLTQVSAQGANFGYAGGGVWAAWLGASPYATRTSVSGFGPLSNTIVKDVNLAGQVLVIGYGAGGPVRVYTPAGVLLRTYSVTTVFPTLVLRADVVAYSSAAGWFLSNTATGAGLTYLQRTDSVNWVIPVDDGGTLWVVERTGDLWVREPMAAVAYNVGSLGTPGTSFNPDAMLISAGVMRIGRCVSAGEAPNDLIVIDLTLATGATSIGTVVAGALSFSAGPTLSPVAIPTGTTTTGGSGGSGGSGGAGSTPSNSNIIRRVTRPVLPHGARPKTYPHVAQISLPHDVVMSQHTPVPSVVRDALNASQQSTRLLWDVYGTLAKGRTADQAVVTAQSAEITRLTAEVRAANATAVEALTAAGKLTAKDLPTAPGPILPPDDGQVGGGPTPPPGGGAVVVPGTADAINAQDVTWMTTNPANWPIGATITNVQITASQICLDYTGKNVWPAVDPDGSGTLSPGNPWVIAFIGGLYYGSTYEWLRVGQICKNVTGPEFQDYVTGTSPLDTWTPALGETVWFMVSSLARNGPQSPVNQRTQIVAVTWPF